MKKAIILIAVVILIGGLIYLGKEGREEKELLTPEEKQLIITPETKDLSSDEEKILDLVEEAERISQAKASLKLQIPKPKTENIKSELIPLSDNPGSYVEFQIIREEEGQTEQGYVKATQIKGYPAIEIYDKVNKEGQIQVLVKDSYILKVESTQLTDPQALRAYVEMTVSKSLYK